MTILGWVIGTRLGAFAGLSFSTTLPTSFVMLQTSVATMELVATGTMTFTITVAQILGVAGILGATYMFASNNRPGNNIVQNKQFKKAARVAGYGLKDPKIKDILNEIHRYIRHEKLNLGYRELAELIKELFC